MHKCLFLLCPTDCLEPIINNTFKYENYFYTSLGNSFISDSKTLACIKEAVIKHSIKEICFTLSSDNRIILDALGKQIFSDIRGLNHFYNEIIRQKKRSKILGQISNRQFLILSYYLNKKIKELQLELNGILYGPIKINGKIYNREKDMFVDIYPDLICLETHHLN